MGRLEQDPRSLPLRGCRFGAIVMVQTNAKNYAGDITPEDAWNILKSEDSSILIDCRTTAEWSYVGVPDLSEMGKEQVNLSWKIFPEMCVNPLFQNKMSDACPDQDAILLFLCRSGVRAIDAAISATEAGYNNAYNILEGFEGDKDSEGHRGRLGGWKFCNLPWKQG